MLGDKVKCIHTGFIGVAVARTEFINGCIQINVVPKWDGKAPALEEMGIDEGSLKVILKGKKHKELDKEEKELGGRSRIGVKQRGY